MYHSEHWDIELADTSHSKVSRAVYLSAMQDISAIGMGAVLDKSAPESLRGKATEAQIEISEAIVCQANSIKERSIAAICDINDDISGRDIHSAKSLNLQGEGLAHAHRWQVICSDEGVKSLYQKSCNHLLKDGTGMPYTTNAFDIIISKFKAITSAIAGIHNKMVSAWLKDSPAIPNESLVRIEAQGKWHGKYGRVEEMFGSDSKFQYSVWVMDDPTDEERGEYVMFDRPELSIASESNIESDSPAPAM